MRRVVNAESETIRPPQTPSIRSSLLTTRPRLRHQIDEMVEHLGFERNHLGPAALLALFDIEHVITEPEKDACFSGRPRAGIS